MSSSILIPTQHTNQGLKHILHTQGVRPMDLIDAKKFQTSRASFHVCRSLLRLPAVTSKQSRFSTRTSIRTIGEGYNPPFGTKTLLFIRKWDRFHDSRAFRGLSLARSPIPASRHTSGRRETGLTSSSSHLPQNHPRWMNSRLTEKARSIVGRRFMHPGPGPGS